METERNLIRDIIEKLDNEYESRGWKIEYIDLRWGISPDASEDNRTMTICLHELDLCRQLSPRPNFILLLGERYGWRPLPEALELHDMERVYRKASPGELKLLDRWYMRDDNYTSGTRFLLRSRAGSGYDGDRFHREVETPLLDLFYRVLPATDCSATEMEIRRGLLDDADEGNHVLAYMRTLTGVPQEERPAYFDADSTSLAYVGRLKEAIATRVDTDDVYREEPLAWAEYKSEAFSKRFADNMERRLRGIIEAEIDAVIDDPISYEEFRHKDFARSEAESFSGRENDISAIRSYIDNDAPDYPLWIKAEPGMGKSALVSKIADDYERDGKYQVLPVFSSLTSGSSRAADVLNFIHDRLSSYLKSKRNDRSLSGLNLNSLVQTLPATKRFLIILDAFNQLDTAGVPNFDTLSWLVEHKGKKLPANVKIVVSSTLTGRFPSEHPYLNIRQLNRFSHDAPGVVLTRLERAGRTLQLPQLKQLYSLLDRAENTGLYLSLLSSELQGYNSSMSLENLPDNYVGLCSMILNRLASPQRHGERLTRLALALIVTSSDGMDAATLNMILALDYAVQEELLTRSFHLWIQEEVRTIPPIIWSRLYYDLENVILVGRVSAIGMSLKVRHGAIAHFLKHKWLTPAELQHARELQAKWYGEHLIPHESEDDSISGCNRLAVRDFVYSHVTQYGVDGRYTKAMDVADTDDEIDLQMRRRDVAKKLLPVLLDERYIAVKQRFFPDAIFSEYDALMRVYAGIPDTVMRAKVLEAKNFIVYTMLDYRNHRKNNAIHDTSTISSSKLQAMMLNLWRSHPLRQIPQERVDPMLMCDELCEIDPERHTVYTIDDLGRLPRLAPSGDAIFRLMPDEDGNMKIEKILLYSGQVITLFTGIKPNIVDYAMSSDESTRVLAFPDKIYVYNQSISGGYRVVRDQGISWISLSENGQYLAYGGNSMKSIREDVLTGGNRFSWLPATEGRLSPSGQVLWVVYSAEHPERDAKTRWEFTVGRCDFNSLATCSSCYWMERTPCFWSRNMILDCSDSVAVFTEVSSLSNDVPNIAKFSDGKLLWWQWKKQAPVLSAKMLPDKDEFYLFYLSSGAYSLMAISDKTLSVVEQGNMHVVNQLTPDFRYALSESECKVFDFGKLRNSFAVNNDGNVAGINSFSASASGNVMAVSTGCNVSWEAGEIRVPILTEADASGVYSEAFLDVDKSKFCHYVSASAISPDGSRLAYCTYVYRGDTELKIYDLKNRLMLAEIPVKDQIGTIRFTGDSRWVVAITGDWIVDVDTVLYVLDHDGRLLSKTDITGFSSGGNRNMSMSPDNRYIAVGHRTDFLLWDILSQKPVRRGKCGFDARECYIFHPVTAELCYTEAEKCDVAAVSASGRYTFTLNDDGTLTVLDAVSGQVAARLDDVLHVMPTFDDRHFYVHTTDNSVALYNIDGELLNYTYLHCSRRLMCWQNTAAGIAIGKHDCRAALFRPDSRWGVDAESVAVARRRWNLSTGKLMEPEAVCPMCGAIVPPPYAHYRAECPSCHRKLHIVIDSNGRYPHKVEEMMLGRKSLAYLCFKS